MKYDHPELIDELAARYAIGTLRGPARRRMERICREHSAALEAVRRWEDRLAGFADEVSPAEPSAAVWQNVRKQLTLKQPHHSELTQHSRRSRWRGGRWLAMAASVAALAVAIGWWMVASPPASQLVAVITDEQRTQLWTIQAPVRREELRVTASDRLSLDASQAYELWALFESGDAPVSLGLMPLSGEGVLPLDSAQRLALAEAHQVAISLEPLGGSPTGAPTGPVLFVAEVVTPG